jgi:hypothetical protein
MFCHLEATIALHTAAHPNGAHNYPFCFSLASSSGETEKPDGIPAQKFHSASDMGILFDLFSKSSAAYKIPGVSAVSPRYSPNL